MKKRWVASNANLTSCGAVMQPLAPNPTDTPLPVPSKVPIPPSLRPNFPANQFNAVQPAGVQFMVANTKLGNSHPALRGTIAAPNSQSSPSACLSDIYVPSKKRSDLTASTPSTQNAHLLDALLVEPQMAGRNLMQHGNRNPRQITGDLLVCQDPSSSTSGRNPTPTQRSEAASQLVISSRSPLRRSPASTTLPEIHQQPTPGVRQTSFTLREFNDISVQNFVQADYLHQQSKLRTPGGLPLVRSPGLPTVPSQPATSSSLLQNVHQSAPKITPRTGYTPVDYQQNSKDFLEFLALQSQQLKDQKQEINPATLLQLAQYEKLRQISPNPTDAVFSAMVTLLTNALTQGGATSHADLTGIDDQALRKQTNSLKTGYQATPPPNPNQAVRDVNLKNSRSKTTGSELPVTSGDAKIAISSSAPSGLTGQSDPTVVWSANKPEFTDLTSAANATTIDILRESKQVSMNVPTSLSALTTPSFPPSSPFVTASVSGPQKVQTVISSSSGTYLHDKQQTRFLIGQADPIDHHFQVALGKASTNPSSAAAAVLLPSSGRKTMAPDHGTSQNCLPELSRNSPVLGSCKAEPTAGGGQGMFADGVGGPRVAVKSSNIITNNKFEAKSSMTAPSETTHHTAPSAVVCGAFSQTISSASSSFSALKEESEKKPDLRSASHAVKRPLMTSSNSRIDDACRFALKKRLIQRYEADGAASFCDIPTEVSSNAAGGKCESTDVDEKPFTKVDNTLTTTTTTTVVPSSQVSENHSLNVSPVRNDALSKLSRVLDESPSFVLDRSSGQVNGSLSEIMESSSTSTATKKVSKHSKPKTTGGGPVAAPTAVQSRRQPPVRATKIALMNTVSLNESAKPARQPKEAGLPRATKAARRPAANAAVPPRRSDPTSTTTVAAASPFGSLDASPLGPSRNRSTKAPRFFTRHREGDTGGHRRRTASLREDENPHSNSPLPDGSGAAASYSASLHDFDFDASESSPAANSTTSSACASSAAGRTPSSRSIPRRRVGGSGGEDDLSPDQKRRTIESGHQLRTAKSTRSSAVSTSAFKLGTPERSLRKQTKQAKSGAEVPVRRRPTRPKVGINAEPSYVENSQDDFTSDEEASTEQPIAERADEVEQHEGVEGDEEDVEEKTDEVTNGLEKTRSAAVCSKCSQRFEPYGYSPSVKAGSLQTDCYDFQCDDNLSTEELFEALPPPPDLAVLSHRSLCGWELPAASQAEGETFLQLNSCSDLEKLKPSLRCRACREVSRTGGLQQATDANPSPASASLKVSNNRRRGHNKQSAASHVAPDAHNGNGGKYAAQKAASSSSAAAAQQNTISVFCRFWGFRKLAYDNKGVLSLTDFCRTVEADRIDRSLWSMHRNVSPPLDRKNALYFIAQLGQTACRLMLSELSILSSVNDTLKRQCHPSNGTEPARTVAWKRPVQGVREMCDVCETTMFNSHWVCTKCGYSVCSACYFAKSYGPPPATVTALRTTNNSTNGLGHSLHPDSDADSSVKNEPTKEDSFRMDASSSGSVNDEENGCLRRSTAEPDRLSSPSSHFPTALAELGLDNYSVRQPWSTCSASRRPHDPSRLMLTALLPCGSLHGPSCPSSPAGSIANEDQLSPVTSTSTSAATSLDLLAELALKASDASPEDYHANMEVDYSAHPSRPSSLSSTASSSPCSSSSSVIRRGRLLQMASRGISSSAVKSQRPGVLYLPDPNSPSVLETFRRSWEISQPVVISNCLKNFNTVLWSPRSLSRDGDSLAAVVVDCETNLIVSRLQMRSFWEGFESSTKRNTSKDGKLQSLKIKEWPPADDLTEVHPERFADIMSNLPIPEYTHRDGQFNLAARLPSFFVRPDLGPRLHIAQDLAGEPTVGTMNLRVDVTDVLNILMHASPSFEPQQSRDSTKEKNPTAVLQSVLRDAGLDSSQLTAPCTNGKTALAKGWPGAIWHIFQPSDLRAIREFLMKRQVPNSQQGREAAGDVIHDQRIYLSPKQLSQLETETGIRPCTVLQYVGDAIFIPSGSVHQVRNLMSCINVSVDFVSAEHVSQCLELTEEFRRLPRNHPSHEDKVQVKNMIYHTVKDSLSTILETNQKRSD
ncbi:hypothetical protein AAHC03_010150 [Spirometra sp. Aus1]